MRISTVAALMLPVLAVVCTAEKADAGLFISISVAPPVLPVYVQPPIPGPGYMWTPGYWAWDEDESDYYWVPGAWVSAPAPGLLWTPGYWGWRDGVYVWNAGYWGPHVGFYGGVSYGFGYTGSGFAGGRWVGGSFSYNRAVVNVGASASITNVYNEKVVVNNTTNVSFNGRGGIQAQPNAQELAAAREPHTPPTGQQLQHQQLASKNPDLRRSRNGGKPSIAATRTAGDFSKKSAVAAKSAGNAGKPVKPVSLKTEHNELKNAANPPKTASPKTDHNELKNAANPPRAASLKTDRNEPRHAMNPPRAGGGGANPHARPVAKKAPPEKKPGN